MGGHNVTKKKRAQENEPCPDVTKKGSRDCWNSRASGQNTITDTFFSSTTNATFNTHRSAIQNGMNP